MRERVRSVAPLPEAGMEWRGEQATSGLRLSRFFQPRGMAYGVIMGGVDPYDAAKGWEIESYSEYSIQAFRIAPRMFFSIVDDTQVSVPTGVGVTSLDRRMANVGEALRYGVELEVGWHGPQHLYLGAQAGWLKTRVAAFDEDGLQRAAGPLPNAPEWNAGVVCAWNPQSGWFVQSALTWQDATYSQFSAPEATRIEDRLELSTRIGYRWKSMEAYAFGTNLLNRDFALVRRDFAETGAAVQGTPNLPRVIGVGVALDW